MMGPIRPRWDKVLGCVILLEWLCTLMRELAVRDVYLDTVRLDGDEAVEGVSQWFW